MLGVGEIGGIRAAARIADVIHDVVGESTGDTVLESWPLALIAARIAPLAHSFLVLVLAIAALPHALALLEGEIWVAGEALELRGAVAALTVAEAPLTDLGV